MKTARTILMTLSSIVTVFVLAFLVAVPAQSALLESLVIEPTDTSPGAVGTTHTFTWTTGTSYTIKSFQLEYCTTPSGTCTGPGTLDIQTVTLSNHVGITDVYTLGTTSANTNIWYYSTGVAITDGDVWSFDLDSVNNQAINACQSGEASSDTCYVRITTWTGPNADGTGTDSNTGSVTVAADVTVTATVDPSFTFVIGAVGASTVSNAITSTVATTYNTLPFSNLTAGTPRYAAHTLTVTTNAQNGYSIYSEMETALTGLYAGNNIDPFMSAWSAETTWTEPIGSTPNVNTGWIAGNTTDTDVGGQITNAPDGVGEFGAIGGTPALVSYDSNQDDGSTSVYVTYGVEVNFYQPADTYTGVLQYTALPSY